MTRNWLLVGLGNIPLPNTRHNAGMMFIDYIQKLESTPQFTSHSFGLISNVNWNQQCIYLLKPNLLMNISGRSIHKALLSLNIPVDRMVVVQDDMDKSFGKIGEKRTGSACGHNGIKSLIQSLGTSDFIRMKIGIGRPESRDPKLVASYVLSHFTNQELMELQQDIFPKVHTFIKTHFIS